MRDARVQDWYRRLRTKAQTWSVRIARVSFQEIPSLGTSELSFGSPLMVLSGPNGVGKSTLLRAIWATLDPASAGSVMGSDRKLSAGSCTAELEISGETVTAEVQFLAEALVGSGNADAEVVFVDAASDTPRIQLEFSRFVSAEEFTNGVAARELDANELAEVNYILHRDYRTIALYEVELGDVVPYFEVTYGDDRYDSRTMGSGEIAALYIWWKLKRADPNNIILVEEPEAFLSHGCQQSLANFIVWQTVEKRLCTVVSSHSAALITSLPKESLCFLARGAGGLQVVDTAPPILLKSMGIDPPLLGIIFVEDAAGAAFCKAILEKLDPAVARRVSVVQRGSDGEVITALRLARTFDNALKFVGFFDGDMRGNIPQDVADISAYLPGPQPVEVLFRETVNSNPDALVTATGNKDVPTILAGLEGAEHHDWYHALSDELGLTKAQLFPIIFKIWVDSPVNLEAAIAAYNELEELLFGQAPDAS